MDRVFPENLFRFFDRFDVEINDNRLLAGADENTFQRFVPAGIDFLMRHIGRHEDEIAGAGFGDELQIFAPAHSCPAFDDVDDAFEIAVMMGAGLSVGVDRHGSRPDLFRARAGMVDRGRTVHAGGLRRIRIERVAGDDLDAVLTPIDGLMVVIVPVSRLMFMIATHGLPFAF